MDTDIIASSGVSSPKSVALAKLVKRQEAREPKEPTRHRLILDTPFMVRSTVSYGLIVYAKDTGRWAITQRKHSAEFLLFIRGLYRVTHLPFLLSCITKNEANTIEKCLKQGPDVFKTTYLNELGLASEGLAYALVRMAELRNIVLNLLPKLDLAKNTLSWTWPKGRLAYSTSPERETPFDCAKREFTEEVELVLPAPLFISDTHVNETIRTITCRNIESRYWIYIIPNEIPMEAPDSHPEVADRIWADTDKCRELIHHDDLFTRVIEMVTSIK
jgi:8-oxo-dGTP pyrophosphatase MutT (NUDIX family)